jgi:SAM-dependent methyltransferase
MDTQTLHRLRAINRRFYEREAESFSATRNHPWPGWTRLLDDMELAASAPAPRVFDVGCGNGRFLAFLTTRWNAHFEYVGCDANAALLAEAREQYGGRGDVSFLRCDLGDPAREDESLPTGPFELIGAFGLLHHIPDRDARRRLLQDLAERLAPGGYLALTFWRFALTERFRRRVIPWEEYNRDTTEPIALDQLDAGDYLLRWGADEGPPRYCHFADEAELEWLLRALTEQGSLREVDRYCADGRSQDLNEYLILCPNGAR